MPAAQLDTTNRDSTPGPEDSTGGQLARLVGHRDSPASSGVDLAGLFNSFLASLGGQVADDGPDGASPLSRLAGKVSESLRKGLEERSRTPAVSPENRAKADRHARAGLRLIQENKLPEAEEELRQAVVLHPAKADWHGNLGVVLARRGKTADAEACFRTALALDPVSPTAHANVGTACAQRGKLQEAETHFRQALFLHPADPNLHEHLGNTLLGLRQPAEARACFQQALQLRPTGIDAKFRLGCLFKEENKLAEAEAALREVLDQKPDHLDALNTLGIVLEDAGKHAESEATYRRALKVKPEAPDVLSNLGVALSSMDRHEEAVAAYRESLRVKPDGVAAHNNIGNALRQLGRLDESAFHLREAIRYKPEYAEAHNNLGIVLIQKGETKAGTELYGKALELRRGDYPEARLNRALAWLSEGDYERGWDEYEFRWKGKTSKLREYPPTATQKHSISTRPHPSTSGWSRHLNKPLLGQPRAACLGTGRPGQADSGPDMHGSLQSPPNVFLPNPFQSPAFSRPAAERCRDLERTPNVFPRAPSAISSRKCVRFPFVARRCQPIRTRFGCANVFPFSRSRSQIGI